MNPQQKDKLSKALLDNSALDLSPHILGEFTIENLFELTNQTEDYRLAFRAAWTLEHIFFANKDLLEKYQTDILDLYHTTENESSLRSLSKLMIELFKNPVYESRRSDLDIEKTLEKSFQIIEKEACPVALLVNCWDILHLISCRDTYDWIKQELALHITFYLERQATPASKSRGLRLLKKLK